jgi:endonuclease G
MANKSKTFLFGFVLFTLFAVFSARAQSWLHSLGVLDVSAAQVEESRTDVGGFGRCQSYFLNGKLPVVPNEGKLLARPLCFDGFAVLHSGTEKKAIYAVEVLTRERLKNAHEKRTDRFYEEARLPAAQRASLEDYRGSGFDRGHNFPAADADTPENMAQSFSLSNMMPQAPENNRGPWSRIEQDTRKYAMRAAGKVYVITGSVSLPGQCPFKAEKCTIGAGAVTVPSHIYKLVLDESTGRAWAHWIANTNDAQISAPITYGELVKRTGIEFFPGLTPKS